MITKEIKDVCKNIIGLMDDYESTDQLSKIADIMLDLEVNFDELNKLFKKFNGGGTND